MKELLERIATPASVVMVLMAGLGVCAYLGFGLRVFLYAGGIGR